MTETSARPEADAATSESRTDRYDHDRDRGRSDRAINAILRVSVALVGLVLLVFALGQIVDQDLFALVVEAATSETGRWVLVAAFALLLIGVAAGWRASDA